MGETNAGKSYLLNALIGEKVFSENKKAFKIRRHIERHQFHHPTITRKIELVDLPGADSDDMHMSQASRTFKDIIADGIDFAVLVMKSNYYLNPRLRADLVLLLKDLSGKKGSNLHLVFNKCDLKFSESFQIWFDKLKDEFMSENMDISQSQCHLLAENDTDIHILKDKILSSIQDFAEFPPENAEKVTKEFSSDRKKSQSTGDEEKKDQTECSLIELIHLEERLLKLRWEKGEVASVERDELSKKLKQMLYLYESDIKEKYEKEIQRLKQQEEANLLLIENQKTQIRI